MSETPKSPASFYGWFVVAACFVLTLVLGGSTWSFGIFIKPLEYEFGWSRGLVSSVSTIFLIGQGASYLVSGRLADRFSPRPILLAAAVLIGLGVTLSSQVQSINQLRFFFFIFGLGAGANWTVPTATIQRWFHGRQQAGMALAIAITGTGVGALLFAPLINHLILSYGWRDTYLITGIIFFALMLAAILVIRQSPPEAPPAVIAGEVPKPARVWTTAAAMRHPSFIGITFILCTMVISFQVVMVHLVPHAIDIGISGTVAAAALGLVGGLSIPGRILAGFFSDRLGWQKVLTLSLLGTALSLLILILLSEAWMLYPFVFFFGLFHGARTTAQLGLLSDFFGMRVLGAIIGITSAVSFFSAAFAPFLAGFIFDATGSYFWAFASVTALILAGAYIAYAIKNPAAKKERR